jgi:hypothetical protein
MAAVPRLKEPIMGQNGTYDIVMWGASQVGKTTALAAYVCKYRPDWIDDDDQSRNTKQDLLAVWNVLEANRLALATARVAYYPLKHAKSDRIIRFRDMLGGHARDLVREELDTLANADAVMLFVAWPGERDVDQLIAAGNALAMAPRRKVALVVTKCETHLRPDELAGLTGSDTQRASRLRGLPYRFQELLAAVGEAWFPVSVFGYRDDAQPAHYRDEFGRIVPWGINPVNVNLPFDHIIMDVV